ncbi:MAG: histidine ammonia-lyase [Rhodothalassiaceae bacterium]|nr:MAG: histidine ammonia-lyase [Rhodothalassiaceae bacterium]
MAGSPATPPGPLAITPGRVPLAALRTVRRGPVRLELPPEARAAIREGAAAVAEILAGGRVVYGVNTGFGLLADRRIDAGHLAELQLNLVRSHACGVGDPLPAEVVRLVLALKVISLARGASGVRPGVVDLLIALLAADALPVIPAKGSVGASGDLAPLAHLALALIGEGEIASAGRVRPAREALAALGLAPLVLGPKEGLALLNGTQVSTALALDALFRTEDAFEAALIAGALSTDAAKGSDVPFDPRIHALRGHAGQIAVARVLRRLLAGSEIRASHADCPKVQDPYCLRCQPQVMGAVLDQLRHVARTLEVEANAVTDNPLVFAAGGDGPATALSGGNFHAEPVAFAADLMAIAAAEIASLSERRIALLTDPKMSGLPAFLAHEPGLQSGLMIAQVTAAALVSENRTLAHPASVDSVPTSAGQEDHVSMATWAGLKAREVARNTTTVVAIELIAGARAIGFHRPLRTSPVLEELVAALARCAPDPGGDRRFDAAIAAVSDWIASGAPAALLGEEGPAVAPTGTG